MPVFITEAAIAIADYFGGSILVANIATAIVPIDPWDDELDQSRPQNSDEHVSDYP